jgi:hypothetical protein
VVLLPVFTLVPLTKNYLATVESPPKKVDGIAIIMEDVQERLKKLGATARIGMLHLDRISA